MPLATLEHLRTVPQLKRQGKEFSEMLLRMAEGAVKDWLKRDIEEKDYTEFYSGDGTGIVVLRQTPVSVVSSVKFDPSGFYGDKAGAFGVNSVLTAGTHYSLVRDSGGLVSNRGILRCLGGIGNWFPLLYPASYGGRPGKLAARQLPTWPVGEGNIKVEYTAGYTPGNIPPAIQAAVINVAAFMAANMPAGGILQSEGLGAYNYSRYFPPINSVPMLGSTVALLAPYREVVV